MPALPYLWGVLLVALTLAGPGHAGGRPSVEQQPSSGASPQYGPRLLDENVHAGASWSAARERRRRRLQAPAVNKRTPLAAPRLAIARLPRLVVRLPALPRWTQPRSIGCPGKYAVTAAPFRAAGDGRTNDAKALAAASAKLPVLYLGVQTYRVGSSVTLTKPIVAGCGARLQVDAGVTLTIAAQPRLWCTLQGLFSGPGRVVFTSAVAEVHPGWFAARLGGLVGSALQRAADTCPTSGCTLLISRAVGIEATVGLNPRNGAFSTAAATIYAAGYTFGSAYTLDALKLRPGRYTRAIHLGNIISMKACLTIVGGVHGANVFVAGMQGAHDGIVFRPQGGTISSTTVSHSSACARLENCVVVDGGTGRKGALTDVSVRVNFLVTLSGQGLLFRGNPPRLTRSGVVFQAVDPTPGQRRFMLLRNGGSGPVVGLIFGAEVWVGGFATGGALPAGQLVSGRFDRLSATISAAPIAIRNSFAVSGTGNTLLLTASVGSAGADFPLATAPNSLARFRGGASVPDSVIYLGLTVGRDWLPGQRRTYYLYTAFAAASAPGRMRCLPFRSGNPGFVCVSIINQHSQSKWQVAVVLANASKSVIRAGFHHRFGFQAGP